MSLFALGFMDTCFLFLFLFGGCLGAMAYLVVTVFAKATADKPEARSKVQDVATGLAVKGATHGAGWVFKKIFKL
jgi:hypothetical protein